VAHPKGASPYWKC